MESLQWTPNLSVGDATLDSDHKKMIAMINMAFDAMNGPDPQAPSVILKELMDYTRYHMAEEEKVMKEMGYPDLEEHRRVHAALTLQVASYQKQVDSASQAVPAKEIFQFLSHWLISHIVGQDLKYAPYLEGLPPERRAKALSVAER